MNGERENNENEEKSKSKEEINERRVDEWMIRPCDIYKEEYDDCTSIKGRFNQYFIFGEYTDCSQWKRDFKNCEKWFRKKDETAFQEIVASETNRRLVRFKAHYENNVWKKREKPPEDWNKPLPDWLQKRFTNSYLDHKSRQIKTGEVHDFETKLCTIL